MFFKICNKYKLASSGFLNKVLDFLPDGSKHSSESRHFLSSSHSLQLHPHVRHVSINIVLHKKVSIIEKRDASALRDTVYRVHFKSGQNLSLLMLQDFWVVPPNFKSNHIMSSWCSHLMYTVYYDENYGAEASFLVKCG